jgi:hypothetical protein
MRLRTFKHILSLNLGTYIERCMLENREIYCVPRGRYHNYYAIYDNDPTLHCILIDIPKQMPWLGSSNYSDAVYTLTEILSDHFRKIQKQVLSGNNPYNLQVKVLE